jgi:hypothetical protein
MKPKKGPTLSPTHCSPSSKCLEMPSIAPDVYDAPRFAISIGTFLKQLHKRMSLPASSARALVAHQGKGEERGQRIISQGHSALFGRTCDLRRN